MSSSAFFRVTITGSERGAVEAAVADFIQQMPESWREFTAKWTKITESGRRVLAEFEGCERWQIVEHIEGFADGVQQRHPSVC